jgi:hypothetical protein
MRCGYYIMSISNNNEKRSLATVSIIIVSLIVLAGGGGFALTSPTTMTTALAQENNTSAATTTATINGDADSDTDGSVVEGSGGGGGGNGNTSTFTTTTLSSSGIELSPQPIYEERSPEPNITPINDTHATLTFTANGTLTLPNTTQTINTTSNGTAIISFTTSSGYGKETIRSEDGDTATATLYEIVQFNPAATEVSDGGGKGIITAIFQTNSTDTLAPLNGMIAAGIDDMMPGGGSHITFWKWESGIGNTTTGIAPLMQE